MASKTRRYRESLLEALADPIEASHYLNAAISDSPEMFLKALRNVAQARQMTKVAKDAGVTRESLYRATSEIGNPTLDTLDSVLAVMGIKIKFEAEASTSPTAVTPSRRNRTTSYVIPLRAETDPSYLASGICTGMLPHPNQTFYVATWVGVATTFQQSNVGKEKSHNLIPASAGSLAAYKFYSNAEEAEKPPLMQVAAEPQNVVQLQP